MTEPTRQPRDVVRRAALMLGATLLVVALGALGLWRTDLGHAALGDLWVRARPGGVLLGVLVISLAMPITAARWRCLLPEPVASKGSLGILTQFQCVAVLFNYALPGPAGELVAATLVRQRFGVSLADALVAGLVARLLGLGVAAGIAGLLFMLAPLPLPEGSRLAVSFGVAGMGLGAMAIALTAAFPQPLRRLNDRLLAPLSALAGLPGRLAARLHTVGNRLLDALVAIGRRGPRPLLKAAAWTAVGHTVSPTGVVIAAWAMGIQVPWAGVVFANAFVIVGALLLFLFPGSQVGWDVLYCSVFSGATGASLADSAAITVLARLQQSFIVLLGIFALLFLAQRMVVVVRERR